MQADTLRHKSKWFARGGMNNINILAALCPTLKILGYVNTGVPVQVRPGAPNPVLSRLCAVILKIRQLPQKSASESQIATTDTLRHTVFRAVYSLNLTKAYILKDTSWINLKRPGRANGEAFY